MNFYSKYIEMCNRISKSPSAVAIEIGLSKPSVNRWKNGGSPTDATAQKIASYFGVSVAYLLGEEEETTEKNTASEESETDRKFLEMLKSMTPEEKEWLLNILKSVIEGRK